jgi:hypothetical protein
MKVAVLVLLLLLTDLSHGSTPKAGGHFFNENQNLFDDFSRYRDGCLIPGFSIPKKQIDSRLQPGSTFEISELYQNGEGPVRRINKEVITWINTGTKIGYFQFFRDLEDVQGLEMGFQNYKSCPFSGGDMVCESYPPEPSHNFLKGEYEMCAGDGSGIPVRAVHSGLFRMRDGNIIKAHRMVESVKTGYFCKGTGLSQVKKITTIITSNEIPSYNSTVFCGGVAIYKNVEVRSLDGKLVFNHAQELTRFVE